MFQEKALVSEMDNLRRFALRLTGSVPDADDLLQSTVLRALEKKHLFQTGTSLFKWSSKIMYNLFVTEYRRKTKFETQYDPESYIEKESVEASQDVKAELSKVSEAMNQLSHDHKEILTMVCVSGMRYQEVAKALQVPVGTVRSRLSRARECLQAILDTPAYKRILPPPGIQGKYYGQMAA
jgi:RNA polymerase sigma-70 factor (ECF subfamily)